MRRWKPWELGTVGEPRELINAKGENEARNGKKVA